ncbi:hypothetical protein TEA_022261 [Camellia sinensis var. sinensis]|uniref:Uncharacterized protein n=1 Tax=Camellia sinensis var. sinensis TaxID=542762 RepID=A0A4S4E1A8_CAMSN|nr:hypothetical protein TEA_022261 [Camellia sinensis var. sinensis]
MESSSVITPEDVLKCLMNDGTIDTMRLKIINQLKANEELKNTTIKMAEQSKVLNTPGAEKQTKRELFDALRQELDLGVDFGQEWADNGKENSDSTSKKRKLDEMNSEGAADEVASGSSKPPAVPDDSSKVPRPSVTT